MDLGLNETRLLEMGTVGVRGHDWAMTGQWPMTGRWQGDDQAMIGWWPGDDCVITQADEKEKTC